MAVSGSARLAVSPADRAMLAQWLSRRRTAQALALRARIVLACAEPNAGSDATIAQRLAVFRPTVLKWRQRFARQGLDRLFDAPRAGAPRSVGDDDVERVIATTLETLPEHATQWSTRLLAARLSEPDGYLAHLARIQTGTASHRNVQIVD